MFERIEVASPSRPWATALAFLVNSTALVLAILVPMLRPDQLPAFNFRELTPPYSVQAPPAPADHPPQPAHNTLQNLDDLKFRQPSSIPHGVDPTPDNPAVGPTHSYIPGATNYDPNLVTNLPIPITSNPPPLAVITKPPRPQTLIVSHLDEGMLIRRVQPVYPHAAVITHTQGTVVLSALISTRGEIEGLQVVSGSPLLVQAALEAVRQWRYRPYILNGSPIEVRTQVTVNFSLQ